MCILSFVCAEIYRLVSRRTMEAGDASDQPAVGAGATVVVTKEDESGLEGKKKSCAGRC